MYHDAFTTFPVLMTERLRLRCLEEKDIGPIQEYLGDSEYMKYTDYPPKLIVNSEIINMWKTDAYDAKAMLRWCVALKDSDLCIGSIYLFLPYGDDSSGRKMDIGYEISKKQANKGYAAEAIKKVVEYGSVKL